jgi:hypothetical protein
LPVQNHVEFIDVLSDLLEVPAPHREYSRLALGGIGLREVGIETLYTLAFPRDESFVVDGEVFDTVKEWG